MTSASAVSCVRSRRCRSRSGDLKHHGASFTLLQFARLAEGHHHIQSVQTVEVLFKKIGSVGARLQAVDRDLFALEFALDHIWRSELNCCDGIIVAPLGSGNQISVSGLIDVIT